MESSTRVTSSWRTRSKGALSSTVPRRRCETITTYYLLFTTHYSLLTTHYSLLTTYYLLFTTHYSLLTTHYSLLTTHYSLLTTYYYLLPEKALRDHTLCGPPGDADASPDQAALIWAVSGGACAEVFAASRSAHACESILRALPEKIRQVVDCSMEALQVALPPWVDEDSCHWRAGQSFMLHVPGASNKAKVAMLGAAMRNELTRAWMVSHNFSHESRGKACARLTSCGACPSPT